MHAANKLSTWTKPNRDVTLHGALLYRRSVEYLHHNRKLNITI